jgi:hypothetical protein
MKFKLKATYILPLVASTALLLLPELAIATTPAAKGLTDLATGIKGQVSSIADVLVVVAYVAGVGFALGGIVQFKAHKDSPAQVPLSKPIVYLAVGACLLFLPSIFDIAGQTVFGGGQKSGKFATAATPATTTTTTGG